MGDQSIRRAPARWSRRAVLAGLGAAAALVASRPVAAVTVTAEPAIDRRLVLHNINTLETVDLTFFREGRYDPDALKDANWFLRDHRAGKATSMDSGLLDFVFDLQRRFGLDGSEPIKVVSAFRAPETNAAQRRRARGIARNSFHCKGQAIDVVLPGVAIREARAEAVAMERGGVGVYKRSGFLHLDVGPPRTW